MTERTRISHVARLKQDGRKIVMITAYDYPTGRLADEAGVDIVLVGDSLGNAVLGYADTIPVTLETMVHHSAAVRRGVKRALLVGDMPFLTCKASAEEALRNVAPMMQRGGVEAVKLEGGSEIGPIVEGVVRAGIPVMGHIGVAPQSVHALSGYRRRGKGEAEAEKLLADALALEEAGCFAIVLECIAPGAAVRISEALEVPAIGIGSGPGCDGQVLVLNDLLGLSFGEGPSFAKEYARLGEAIGGAIGAYARDVRSGEFPGEG